MQDITLTGIKTTEYTKETITITSNSSLKIFPNSLNLSDKAIRNVTQFQNLCNVAFGHPHLSTIVTSPRFY